MGKNLDQPLICHMCILLSFLPHYLSHEIMHAPIGKGRLSTQISFDLYSCVAIMLFFLPSNFGHEIESIFLIIFVCLEMGL